MNAERIEQLRERIREGLVVIAGDIQDVSDIIIIIREKAEQMGEGPTERCAGCGRQAADDPSFPDEYCRRCWKEYKAEQIKAGATMDEGSIGAVESAHELVSPGLSEDERAVTTEQILDWLYQATAMKRREDGLRVICDAQWNADMRSAIRARLAAESPKVTREWMRKWAIEFAVESKPYDDVIRAMLREIGVVVTEAK